MNYFLYFIVFSLSLSLIQYLMKLSKGEEIVRTSKDMLFMSIEAICIIIWASILIVKGN